MTSSVFRSSIAAPNPLQQGLPQAQWRSPSFAVAQPPKSSMNAADWDQFDRPDRITQWRALAKWAAEPNPFYEDWFLLPSLRAFDAKGSVKLLYLEVDGQLAGLLPVAHDNLYYGHPLPHLTGWLHANIFLGAPLVAKGFEHMFWQHLLDYCDDQFGLLPPLFLHLSHMPAEGPLTRALAEVLERSGRPAATVKSEQRAMLSSTLDAETYLAQSMSNKKRKELRRQSKRLNEEGVLSFERLSDDEGVAEWAKAFTALEQKGWKGRAGSALGCSEDTAGLFEQALVGAAQAGRLERLSLSLDGKPIAMLANFICSPGGYSFKTTFDEDYSRFSPGVLLQRENLDILARTDIDWVDSCAAQDHPMIDRIWRERRVINRYSIAIGGRLRRAAFRVLIRKEIGQNPGHIT